MHANTKTYNIYIYIYIYIYILKFTYFPNVDHHGNATTGLV